MIERKYYIPRIGLSLLIGLLSLLMYQHLFNLVNNTTLTSLLIFSFISLILIFINYNLLILHINRAKLYKNSLKHIVFAFVCGVCILTINHFLLHGFVPTIDQYLVSKYTLLVPLALITFSFNYIFSYTLLYKVLTDKIKFENNHKLTIIVTCAVFALLLGLFLPNLITSFFNNFILYLSIFLVISICYNSSHNLFIGMFGISLSFFLYNLIILISF